MSSTTRQLERGDARPRLHPHRVHLAGHPGPLAEGRGRRWGCGRRGAPSLRGWCVGGFAFFLRAAARAAALVAPLLAGVSSVGSTSSRASAVCCEVEGHEGHVGVGQRRRGSWRSSRPCGRAAAGARSGVYSRRGMSTETSVSPSARSRGARPRRRARSMRRSGQSTISSGQPREARAGPLLGGSSAWVRIGSRRSARRVSSSGRQRPGVLDGPGGGHVERRRPSRSRRGGARIGALGGAPGRRRLELGGLGLVLLVEPQSRATKIGISDDDDPGAVR